MTSTCANPEAAGAAAAEAVYERFHQQQPDRTYAQTITAAPEGTVIRYPVNQIVYRIPPGVPSDRAGVDWRHRFGDTGSLLDGGSGDTGSRPLAFAPFRRAIAPAKLASGQRQPTPRVPSNTTLIGAVKELVFDVAGQPVPVFFVRGERLLADPSRDGRMFIVSRRGRTARLIYVIESQPGQKPFTLTERGIVG